MARLRIQLWDRDLLKSNELIGSASVNLFDWLLLVYHRNETLYPFKEAKEVPHCALSNGILLLGEDRLTPVYA
jgi:hypothetical protein